MLGTRQRRIEVECVRIGAERLARLRRRGQVVAEHDPRGRGAGPALHLGVRARQVALGVVLALHERARDGDVGGIERGRTGQGVARLQVAAEGLRA